METQSVFLATVILAVWMLFLSLLIEFLLSYMAIAPFSIPENCFPVVLFSNCFQLLFSCFLLPADHEQSLFFPQFVD